ncbi:predicted protein [Thalassiosira pseudonana CCMP1335]|uniref:Uncharacterized protein n=1 Tax=Thalassiosira pseudonana TaxID=35128 RepID=B8C4P2_THAPS|nr:predicted protein [Thalassiosira pseudonana CCMP1335]EED91359.1 predicted protein [Thalassiosira pseudonana CCMP1335]|eukprot:scaffold2031_cov185-Alexandrium_tamarense.AAC.14
MSDILPQKRSKPDAPSTNNDTRYNRLLSVLQKSLSASRERIESDASTTILQSYGDLTAYFSQEGEDDNNGVDKLVEVLLTKLDKVHERFQAENAKGKDVPPLELLLKEKQIMQLLGNVESSIAFVEKEEAEFKAADEQDKQSARTAVNMAKVTKVGISPKSGKEKKRRLLPGEYIGYHAYQMKLDHKALLEKELLELEKENDVMEGELRREWEGWNEGVKNLEGVLGVFGKLGEGNGKD